MAQPMQSGPAMQARAPDHPVLRAVAIAWLCVWLPAYATTYGAWHFLYLCNLGVLVTCLGLIAGSQLLLSSQALIAPGIAMLWIADATTRVLTGHFLHGGTAYMWDASIPALTRTLSLYHLAWPLLLYHALRRHGYDRRGWRLQGALAAGALALGLFVAPVAENIDYVWHAPGAAAPSTTPLLRAAGILGVLLAIGWPLHRLCLAVFDPVASARASATLAAAQPAAP